MLRRNNRIGREMDHNRNERVKATRDGITVQIEKDFTDIEAFPFQTCSKFQNKRVVVGDGTQMTMMRSNKRFKPGD